MTHRSRGSAREAESVVASRVMRVVVADLGLGNLRSVERAVERAATQRGPRCTVVVSGDPHVLSDAELLVFPGQGAFRDGAAALVTDAGRAIARHVSNGRPYFGICLGLQLLFETSDEAPGAQGLGVFAGAVRRLGGPALAAVGDRKVPHMGWNTVHVSAETPLARVHEEYMYFVHGYAAVPVDPGVVCATSSYGAEVTAAVHRANVLAVQFHPEKSQAAGARVLDDVLAWAEEKVSP
jgi:glutamine amidotransferase